MSFNLVIEILIVDRLIDLIISDSIRVCFNLVIEILIVDRANTYTISATDTKFQSRNRDSYS